MPDSHEPVSVVIRLSTKPCNYHLIEVYTKTRAVVLQIKNECSKASVCEIAAAIAGIK